MLTTDAVRAWIINFLVSLLDIDPNEISGDIRFNAIGLDSVDAVVMAGAMEEHFNVEVDAVLFLRNSNINGLLADLQENGIIK